MALKIMEEVTAWDVEYPQPNHVYLMDGDKVYAYSKWGKEAPQYMKTFLRIDLRRRKFVEAKKNRWKFKFPVSVDQEEQVTSQPLGQIWQVAGSKGNVYTVNLHNGQWTCTCPGHQFRRQCRHVEELKVAA